MKLLAIKLPGGYQVDAPTGVPTYHVNTVLQNSVGIFIGLAVIVTIIMIIWSGIQWITSAGDKQRIDAAKTRITITIIGLIIIFSAFFIISVVGKFFGVSLLDLSAF